jgi:hypothetical protein
MVKKAFQSSSGGLNEKGRKALGMGRKLTSGTNPRRVSFAARWGGMKGPMKDEKGRPTRKALMGSAWGFESQEAARNFAQRHKKT